MTRVRMLFAIALPSLLVGGLVLGDRSGRAAADVDHDSWASGPTIVADGRLPRLPRAPRLPPVAPVPPVPPVPPTPPVPPVPPAPAGSWWRGAGGGHHGGVSISIHDGKVRIDGVAAIVNAHLDAVRAALQRPNVPQDVRDRLTARLDVVRRIVERRLRTIDASDLDALEAELTQLGEEMEHAFDGLDDDLQGVGDRVARDLTRKLAKDLFKQLARGRLQLQFDGDDDDHDADRAVDVDVDTDTADTDTSDVDTDTDTDDRDDADPADVAGAVMVGDLALLPAQHAAITKLRAEADARVAAARQALARASRQLEAALGDSRTTDAEVARLVDLVSSQEAAIRKARLLTWVQVRRLLDAEQVRLLERAARGH